MKGGGLKLGRVASFLDGGKGDDGEGMRGLLTFNN